MTIPSLFQDIADQNGDVISQLSREGAKKKFLPVTFAELYTIVEALAWSLEKQGVSRGIHVGLISDNRKEWLALDLAILSLGAADVPRGCDTMPGELEYILSFSECSITILENTTQLDKIMTCAENLKDLKKVILIEGGQVPSDCPWEVLEYQTLLEEGMNGKTVDFLRARVSEGKEDDLATLIYTSGTTGEPKGVMLTHGNFLCQIENIHDVAQLDHGDIWLSILPVWHSLERVAQYIAMGAVNTIAYSKPIGKVMLMDLQELNPQWMASVPRIWLAIEAGVIRNIRAKGPVAWGMFRFFLAVASARQFMQNRLTGCVADFHRKITFPFYILYPIPWLVLTPLKKLGDLLIFNKIKEKVGTRFKAGISGGGALPPRIYKFFQAIGIQILEGYGLTETAPVVAFSPQHHPVMGVVGQPYPQLTQIKVVDETGKTLPPGEKGVVMLKGRQVMKGYYKKPEATAAMIDSDGWLNSGDLGVMTIKGELKIIGREKDTIVLLGGENIEPVPMEQKLSESPYIEQAVVVGQDQKYLAALIVPDFDALESYALENNLAYENRIHLKDVHAILELLSDEINQLISSRNGFRPFERIFKFEVLRHSFEVGKELSGKQDMKRHAIADIYKKEIARLFE